MLEHLPYIDSTFVQVFQKILRGRALPPEFGFHLRKCVHNHACLQTFLPMEGVALKQVACKFLVAC